MRVAVVSPDPLAPSNTSAKFLAMRNWSVLQAAAADNETLVVFADEYGVALEESQLPSGVDARQVRLASSFEGRVSRSSSAVREIASRGRVISRWQRDILGALDAWRPDVVIALRWFGLDSRLPFRALGKRHRLLAFIDEDFTVHPERHKRTVGGRALDLAELRVWHRAVQQAAAVAVVSERELAWARATFPRQHVGVVPLRIDENYWLTRSTVDRSASRDVLVLGQLGSERNALGLVAAAEAIAMDRSTDRLRLVTASATAPHPMLATLPGLGVKNLGFVADPRPLYQSALAALVPSVIVSGAKTTILQGWAARCPVVTTSAAADSVGAQNGVDVLVGDTGRDLVTQLRRLVADRSLGPALERAGSDRLSRHHGQAAVSQGVNDLLHETRRAAVAPESRRGAR